MIISSNIKLKLALDRCNKAYELYKEEKKYYQAKRIFKANIELHNILKEYLYLNPKRADETINFIFHLEDWFEQFQELEKSKKMDLKLTSEFVFDKLSGSPSFPINFLDL